MDVLQRPPVHRNLQLPALVETIFNTRQGASDAIVRLRASWKPVNRAVSQSGGWLNHVAQLSQSPSQFNQSDPISRRKYTYVRRVGGEAGLGWCWCRGGPNDIKILPFSVLYSAIWMPSYLVLVRVEKDC